MQKDIINKVGLPLLTFYTLVSLIYNKLDKLFCPTNSFVKGKSIVRPEYFQASASSAKTGHLFNRETGSFAKFYRSKKN